VVISSCPRIGQCVVSTAALAGVNIKKVKRAMGLGMAVSDGKAGHVKKCFAKRRASWVRNGRVSRLKPKTIRNKILQQTIIPQQT